MDGGPESETVSLYIQTIIFKVKAVSNGPAGAVGGARLHKHQVGPQA